MPEINLNGVDYFYRRRGTGPALLLLHGFTGSSQGWAWVMEQLAGRYDLIAIDLLGHGRTAAPPEPDRYQMTRAAADLLCLLDTLKISTANVLGYSMGGRLALFLAANHPHRWQSLILESASAGLAAESDRLARRKQDNQLANRLEAQDISTFVDEWEKIPLFASRQQLSPEVHSALRAQRLQNSTKGLANSLRGMGTGQQPSLWAELPTISVPVLLLAGVLDEKFMKINAEMENLLPAARLESVAGAGHTIHLEQPERFITAVSTFLEQHNPQTPAQSTAPDQR
jgi:2-succinyl-6-hydroxy-2,4-cyclohexadiene-1-carboxylate synthase